MVQYHTVQRTVKNNEKYLFQFYVVPRYYAYFVFLVFIWLELRRYLPSSNEL